MQKVLYIFFMFIQTQFIFAENKAEPEKKSESKEAGTDAAPVIEYTDIMMEKARGFTRTPDYVHTWIEFPEAIGKSLSGGVNTYKPKPGYISVLIFISSWNVKSQELMKKFKEMETKFTPLKTDFLYIFTHDTFAEASAFAKEHQLNHAMLGEHDINKAFHNPTVPSMYIADRRGWLIHRFIDISSETTREASYFLDRITPI